LDQTSLRRTRYDETIDLGTRLLPGWRGERVDAAFPARAHHLDALRLRRLPSLVPVHRPCGRRAAKLYLSYRARFDCRRCCDLAYVSQSESPQHRAIRKAQKARIQLGGGPSLLDPFPGKPPRMHRRTYCRLFNKAAEAQERATASICVGATPSKAGD
jgi:hypothetical protein